MKRHLATIEGRGPLLLALAGSSLLLLLLLETIFAHGDVSGRVSATAFGIPVACLLIIVAKKALKKLDSMDLFAPLVAFPILYVCWFACASMVLSDDLDPLPYGYFVLGLVCYLAGAVLARRPVPERAVQNSTAVEDEWVPELFWKAIAGLGILGVIAYVTLIAQMGIPVLSSDVGEIRNEIGSYGISKAIFLSAAWTNFILLSLQLSRGKLSPKLKRISIASLIIISAALLSLGNRGFLIVPAVSVIAARQHVGKRFKLATLVLVVMVAFVAASMYGYFRDTLLTQGYVSMGQGADAYSLVFPVLYAGVYMQYSVATFRDVTNVIPSRVPFQHGALSLGALTQLFPGHQESSDMFFKRILGSDFIGGGQPATVLGPLYGDFGVIGIAVGMFLFGVLCSTVYSWMRRRPTILRAAIYGWVAQTALIGVIGFFFTYIVTLWIPLLWLFLDALIRRRGLLDMGPTRRMTDREGIC